MKLISVLKIAIIICLFSFPVISQNNGFIGKKNIVSLDARFYVPMIYNVLRNQEQDNHFKADGDNFQPARNLLSTGLNLTLGRTLSNKFAVYVQVSQLNYKINIGDEDGSGNNQNYILKSTYFAGRARGIMPIIEFSGTNSILPVGVSHQIGIGFYSHSIIDKDYLILVSNASWNNTSQKLDEETLYDYENYRVRTRSYMYKLNFRLPINRRMLWNFGFRYNLNYTELAAKFKSYTENYIFSELNHRDFVRKSQATNITSIETGVTFVF